MTEQTCQNPVDEENQGLSTVKETVLIKENEENCSLQSESVKKKFVFVAPDGQKRLKDVTLNGNDQRNQQPDPLILVFCQKNP